MHNNVGKKLDYLPMTIKQAHNTVFCAADLNRQTTSIFMDITTNKLDDLVKAGYKQTEVGVIPEDWGIFLIPEITKQVNNSIKIGPFGSALKKELLVSYGYKVYGQENVYEKNMDIGERYISKEHFNRLKSCEILTGDFLISMMGTIGKCFVVPSCIDRGIMDSHLLRLRLNQQKIEIQILVQLFNTKLVFDQIAKLSVGGIMEGLSSKIIKNICIPLSPAKAEQTAIAKALSDTDALIQSIDQLIAKKRLIKQGAMQQLLNPYDECGGVKEGWMINSLGEYVDAFVGGGTPSRSNKDYWGKEIPWVTVKDFATFNPLTSQEYITYEGLRNSATNLIPKGTIITSTRMGLGKVIVYGVDVAINQDLKAIFPKKSVYISYLLYWFKKNAKKIEDLGSGSTVMGISLGDLRKVEFSMPTKTEQTQIAQTLSDMDTEITALETKRAKYQKIKQGMMQNLLTGRIRLV